MISYPGSIQNVRMDEGLWKIFEKDRVYWLLNVEKLKNHGSRILYQRK